MSCKGLSSRLGRPVERTGYIAVIIQRWFLDGAGYAGQGCLMENEVDVGNGRFHHSHLSHVSNNQFHRQLGQIFPMAAAQII